MQHLHDFLNTKVDKYNCIDFIEHDPISIPHKYSSKNDIEVAGFLTATIAWGNRKAILKSANQLMQWMDNSPYDFIINHSEHELNHFEKYVYRTFNGKDCIFFIQSLQNIYGNHGGLEAVFQKGYLKSNTIETAICYFREIFLETSHLERSTKHLANPAKGSSAKRINMFLRWMVRKEAEIDFGIWNKIKMADLLMPLDVHTGTISRKLELLERKSNDWKAVIELTNKLKEFDPNDPVKYDFALFGLGVNNDF